MATAELRQPHPQFDAPRGPARTAVILNKNAKRVTGRVRREVEALAPEGCDVFFTESLEQARFLTRRIVDSGYDLVVTGGGDGTVANTIDQVITQAERQGRPCPRFAILKLGTGNAVASFVGSGHYKQNMRQLSSAPYAPLHLLEVEGQRVPFGGVGWDAYILNNYHRMRQVAERFLVTRALFKTVAGYLIAGVGKSVPELIVRRPSWKVRVINTGGMGFRYDVDGNVIDRIAPGAVAFEGDTRMACFGTCPYYGFKMKIMPLADRRPGMFHLRLIDMHPLQAVAQLRQAWNGRIEGGVTDLVLDSMRMEFEEPVPFQIAGDGAGERRVLDVWASGPYQCARFNRA